MMPTLPSPSNPVLLRLVRGTEIEAFHRGAFCVVGPEGVLASGGDVAAPCFIRSGGKPFQVLPFVRRGAVDRFGLGEPHIALACASHGGEPAHVAVAAEMLAAGKLAPESLQCGAHAPLHRGSALALREAGERPTALHNNCSGKHAAMLLACLAAGEPTDDYLDPSHPLQREIRGTLAELAGVSTDEVRHYVDGCSAPTFVLPLRAVAAALAHHSQPGTSLAHYRDPLARIHRAIGHHPFMMGGTGRLCSRLPETTGGRVLGKVGAEGFYGAWVPSRGWGIALHVDDGSCDAAERILVGLLHGLGVLTSAEVSALSTLFPVPRTNHAGLTVGRFELELPALTSLGSLPECAAPGY